MKEAVDFVDKYLGLTYTKTCDWSVHAKKVLAKMYRALGAWRHILKRTKLPTKVRLMMIQTLVYTPALYGSCVWQPSRYWCNRFDAVAKSTIRISRPLQTTQQHRNHALTNGKPSMVFHLSMHDFDVAVLFGEAGMLPPSTLMDLAKLQWKHQIGAVVHERWISAQHQFPTVGSCGAGRPRAGPDWPQDLLKLETRVQNVLNVESTSVHVALQNNLLVRDFHV